MKYETVKSFILVLLVGLSVLLSFLLWTYQPKYDFLHDTSYVNEVDVGGSEKTKNEVIEPKSIVFHQHNSIAGFRKPVQQQRFFKELASWVLYDYEEMNEEKVPEADQMVEITFPTNIPAELITNLFTFDEDITAPNWSFHTIYLTLDAEEQLAHFIIPSTNGRKQVRATIDKSETYYYLMSHMEQDTEITEPFAVFDEGDEPIYFPKNKKELAEKTFIANMIEPESFVNALFATPSIVTSNMSESYFTDGQRGMEVVQDGRRLEYINPIQATDNRLEAYELIEKSVSHINEHKGWTNDFFLDRMDVDANKILYRMYYEGYPTFDNYRLTTIKEQWHDDELYQYIRPLISVGNLLNSTKKTLQSGEEIATDIMNSTILEHDGIEDIQIGYTMEYVDDAYSLKLEPTWYILYKGDWIKFDSVYGQDSARKGGD